MSKVKARAQIQGLSETEDTLLQMVVALTAQLSATRERLDSVEALLTAAGTLPVDAVENFAPTVDDQQRRSEIRSAIIAKVIEPIPAGLTSEAQGMETTDV